MLNKIKHIFRDMPDFPYRLQMWISRNIISKFRALFFCSFGKNSVILSPLRICGSKYIQLEDNVIIDKGAYLYALYLDYTPKLIFKKGARIGHFSHIVAVHSVIIEEDVLIADRVYIGDNAHVYEDNSISIINQGVKHTGDTVIGKGSWIGDNVCVISSKIGKHCVIAANSVVVTDIPNYSIAAGNPAKVVKQYSIEKGEWIRCR